MFIHNLDPVLFDFGFLEIRWYSLAYIFGILFGWWFGKHLIKIKFYNYQNEKLLKDFDDLVTFLIISIILGGRLGYIIFYNLEYYTNNPFEIVKVWKGGMSFHGALIGIVIGTYLFSVKKGIKLFLLLDIIACVSPIGIFFGRIANFINSELVGKVTNVKWSVVFPIIDSMKRHPSQIYEAILEGIVLFIIMCVAVSKKNYRIGTCSFLFLISYGVFRVIAEIFREPDVQIGYLFNFISMGTLLSTLMILTGLIIYIYLKKNEN